MSVSVDKVTKVYGVQKALDEVSFTIPAGQIVGLLGPNGAGKSTIMKILTCFIPPTFGTASVNGLDVIENSIEVRRLVGYLPEHNPLYTDMYVREYLEFSAGIYQLGKSSKSRIDEMIEQTGLTDERHKKIAALSKGYRQRVGLAQALLHNPEVLILDEPTSGLDPNQLIDIRNLIKKMGEQKTVILSTHIMQEVEAVCDRAIIINKGKIVADDKTANIIKSGSRDMLIVELDKAINESLFKSVPSISAIKYLSGNTWQISAKNMDELRQELMKWAVNNKLAILSMRRDENSMEESFHRLTKD
ncbi:MAG: gliding motility-associated ABC transporter ATP-binding subunit GldA [Bacteroidales bacterium]|nr:gliding motility-associated ABC transporter ATP-binding subunit GldA [Bacteroidales bacterium]